MRLVRSDTPEVARCIASARVRASRRWPSLLFGLVPNALILIVAITLSLSVSMRAAAWLCLPVLLAWNVYVLWFAKSSRLNWCVAVCSEEIYLRLFMARGGTRGGIDKPDVVVLETPEIASVSARTLEVLLYGPKPKTVEWLVIQLSQETAEHIDRHVGSLLENIKALDLGNLVHVTNEEAGLTIGWKWCHPALRVFLSKVIRECPSVIVAPEERSKLDLNGIWAGNSMNLDAQQRQMLVQVNRLGFGPKCTWLLRRKKYISFLEAKAYLAELEQDETGTGYSAAHR